MANALYDKGRQGFLDGSIDWDTDDIRAILIDVADYTVNLATHDNLDDIPEAARVAVSAALTGKSVTDGVADAADVTFSAVTGDSVEAIVLYKHTGTESTSRLIAYIDSATGLPLTPNGGAVMITWPDRARKIFKL
jgi:cobalamin synthase